MHAQCKTCNLQQKLVLSSSPPTANRPFMHLSNVKDTLPTFLLFWHARTLASIQEQLNPKQMHHLMKAESPDESHRKLANE